MARNHLRMSWPALAPALLLVGTLALLAAAPAWAFNINKDVTIGEGETSGGAATVNGSIRVGRSAVVNGGLETVNGSIRVQDDARIENAETVNGTVRLADGVTASKVGSVNGDLVLGSNVLVDGALSVVNGRIEMGAGSRVSRDVSNVNGAIDIEGGDIGGDLSTVNGDVNLSGNTVLRGDLSVEVPKDLGRKQGRHKPRIVIGPGVQVVGRIVLEREVELYVSESAKVGEVTGVMGLDQATRFSGQRP